MRFNVNIDKEEALNMKMASLGIKESDLEEKFIRSSKKGGQKVNKSSSCVYLKHRPTGIEVKCQKERSQALNRFFARRILVNKIESLILGKKASEEKKIEKIRRQKRKRSKRAKEKILRYKKMHSEKKKLRKTPILVILIFFSMVINGNLEARDVKYRSLGPKIGLVLGGGGARGASHIGVLKVLEENHIPIDYIVGTSMGAIVGGLYASGMSPEEMEENFKSVDWKDLFTDRLSEKELSFRNKGDRRKFVDLELGLKNGKIVFPKGIISGHKLSFLLKSMLLPATTVKDFDLLHIPFRAIATDIETGQEVILKDGNLAEAIRASMSIPGAFTPVEINGRVLVDGGAVNNLPIDIARKMGADIIIAVDVGMPLAKRDELDSALDITMQVIGIMTQQNVDRQISQIRDKDILIRPDLGDITTADFSKVAEAIPLGVEKARGFIDDLKRYSISEDRYKDFLASQRKDDSEPTKIDFVKIKKPLRVSSQAIKERIKTKPGANLSTEELKSDMRSIYSIGDFEQVDYDLIEEDNKKGLLIDTKEKSWGPNYMKLGLNLIDDFEGGSFYNVVTKYTMTQLNDLGAEWDNEFQMGRTPSFFSEFYQPLDYGETFFIAPKFRYERSVKDIYTGNTRVAQYRTRYLSGGLDMGINFGTYAEARLGIVTGKVSAGRLIGEEALPNFNIDQGALVGSFVFDQFDDSNFPKHGILSNISLFMSRKDLGADESYDKLEFGFMDAATYDKHTFMAHMEGGSSLKNDIPYYDELTLGGFLSLSGYRRDQLRGQYKGVGRLIYYYELSKASNPLMEGICVGGYIESGNVWDKSSDIDVDSLLFGGTLFVGVDTIFGPLYLGYGRAEGSKEGRAYLFLGQTF